jgi:hypothetical protein
MAKRTLHLRIKNVGGKGQIYIKAPFLEKLFSRYNRDHYGSERLSTIYVDNGEVLYMCYLLSHLPETPHTLQASYNVFEAFGFLRAKGLAKGLTMQLDKPVPVKVATAFKEAVSQTVDYLHAAYCDQYVLTHTIEYTKEVGDDITKV